MNGPVRTSSTPVARGGWRRWSPTSGAMTRPERLVTAAVDELAAVDILVNNGGIGRFGPASVSRDAGPNPYVRPWQDELS